MHRFEDLAQRLIENSLARILHERLRPDDVLHAVVRAIDDAKALDSHGEPIAPNHFWITLSEQDLAPLEYFQADFADQLAESVRQMIVQIGLRMDMPPRVLLQGVGDISPHELRVTARWIPPDLPATSTTSMAAQAGKGSAFPRNPFLIVDGRRQIALTSEAVVIGRAREIDIVVDDRRVSRHHAELRWQPDTQKFLYRDLNSTGGTKLNGYPIQQCTLEAGDILSLGGVEIIYGEEFALQSTRANAPINADTDTPAKP
ncbi:MAG: FHA domain-containing protein [Chloroflexi bacterium]|nr:FHA domain-containing protein [Chloroflexota bacterium]MCL5273653.1 FHA domain-containing protein [Chloroflexota bacterium]